MISISRREVGNLPGRRERHGEPRLLRRVVIAALAVHLANSAAMTFGALLMLGHGMGNVATSGEWAMPYIAVSSSIVIFALFAAALVSFIRRGSYYLPLAAAAGIGGYLVTLGINWLRYGVLVVSLQSFLYFLFPMICLSLYRLISGRRQTA